MTPAQLTEYNLIASFQGWDAASQFLKDLEEREEDLLDDLDLGLFLQFLTDSAMIPQAATVHIMTKFRVTDVHEFMEMEKGDIKDLVK